MKYSLQIQQHPIEEAVRARYAMAIPILRGMLLATKREMVDALGGYERITLEQFSRIYVESPGDYGICFEYAVHQSLQDRDPGVYPLVSQTIKEFCGIDGGAESILFGAEKSGHTHVLESVKDSLTDESRVLVGRRMQPPKLRKYIDKLVSAFRSEKHRETLPQSIRGLWKADLFIGNPVADRWVATTLKIRRQDLEAAPGLRVGLFPEERPGESPRKDEENNLILCPLPYSGDFMQLYGASFGIVKQIVAAKGSLPSRVALHYEDDQAVAKWLVDRNHYPLVKVLEALEPLKQPGLVKEDSVSTGPDEAATTEAAAPIPLVRK